MIGRRRDLQGNVHEHVRPQARSRGKRHASQTRVLGRDRHQAGVICHARSHRDLRVRRRHHFDRALTQHADLPGRAGLDLDGVRAHRQGLRADAARFLNVCDVGNLRNDCRLDQPQGRDHYLDQLGSGERKPRGIDFSGARGLEARLGFRDEVGPLVVGFGALLRRKDFLEIRDDGGGPGQNHHGS